MSPLLENLRSTPCARVGVDGAGGADDVDLATTLSLNSIAKRCCFGVGGVGFGLGFGSLRSRV